MFEFGGRVAIVTGAASGIGLGIARALARRGTDVVVTDIEEAALAEAARVVSSFGVRAVPIVLDVSDRKAVYAVADRIVAELGRLDIVVNNAGICYNAKPLYEMPDDMIDWSIAVNLCGVLNGIKAFVPKVLETGQGGHVVNTSSIGGFQVRKNAFWHQGLYAATKYGVTALSEGLRIDLEDLGVGVSVLAPSAVATNIGTSDRNRPDKFGGATTGSQSEIVDRMLKEKGLSPELVGDRVITAIEANELYVFTDAEALPLLSERHRGIERACGATREWLAVNGRTGE